MSASKQSGAVSFSVDGTSRQFRFTVTTTYDKLSVWLEDTTTKQQWQTRELTKEEFTTPETALPQATAEDYAMRIVECLTPAVAHTGTSRSLSGPLGDGTLVLRVGFALQALRFSTPLEYKFTLTSVKVSTVDVINARLKDVDKAAKAAVDEVTKLRFENEKLEDRLDKFKYEHRLMKEELAQFKQQQQWENTKILAEVARFKNENKVLEKSMQQLKAENRALTEEMVGAGHKRKRYDV